MNIYYYTGTDVSNFHFEILPLIEELKKRGHILQSVPRDYKSIETNAPIITNIPDMSFFNQIKELGKERLYQITRSTDSVYCPRYIAKDAFKICVACEYEYDAVSQLLGKDKVALTGMPYLDHYAQSSQWKREEIAPFMNCDGKYILGIQMSYQAHSSSRLEYHQDFENDFYRVQPRRFPHKIIFKIHQNHNEHWPTPSEEIDWIHAFPEWTPRILHFSKGFYTEHFSFMLLEAIVTNKPIYIHEPYESWTKMEENHRVPGWWSDFNWQELKNEKRRKKVASWFPPIGSNSTRIADLIESCA